MAARRAMAVTENAVRRTAVAGVIGGDRFRLETGRSGKRHVFSRIDGAIEAADLLGAVVLLCEGGHRVWLGPGEWLRPGEASRGVEVYAHWLAETPAARARVLADLDGAPIMAEAAEVGSARVEPAMAA